LDIRTDGRYRNIQRLGLRCERYELSRSRAGMGVVSEAPAAERNNLIALHLLDKEVHLEPGDSACVQVSAPPSWLGPVALAETTADTPETDQPVLLATGVLETAPADGSMAISTVVVSAPLHESVYMTSGAVVGWARGLDADESEEVLGAIAASDSGPGDDPEHQSPVTFTEPPLPGPTRDELLSFYHSLQQEHPAASASALWHLANFWRVCRVAELNGVSLKHSKSQLLTGQAWHDRHP
jgi:hypothetical protein